MNRASDAHIALGTTWNKENAHNPFSRLRDAPQSSYFESLSRKAHEGAINQARIDVAEAQRLGNVGEAARQGEQNREIAKINAETAVQKTERDSEKAKAEATLATRKTVFNRDVNIAQIEATRATEARDEELRKDVEVKRAQTELERLRATDVVKATIARESKQQAADAKNYEEQARSNAGMVAVLSSHNFTAWLIFIQLSTASKKQPMPMPTRFALRLRPGSSPHPRTPRLCLSDSKRRPPVCLPWLVPMPICRALLAVQLVSSNTS